MTKKDYKVLAEIFGNHLKMMEDNKRIDEKEKETAFQSIEMLLPKITNWLAIDNNKFDTERFIEEIDKTSGLFIDRIWFPKSR